LFFVAMFLAPVAQLIPTYATATALIYVGVLMMNGVKEIDWNNPSEAVVAFLTMAIMPLTYNISYGIAIGILAYVFIKVFSGKAKEVNIGCWIIGLLFLLMFFLSN
ncbi:MAG: NCS2 family permease, partial [Clostridia bacterium]|nr:NCS2 family permease [Clostridia bacterium]